MTTPSHYLHANLKILIAGVQKKTVVKVTRHEGKIERFRRHYRSLKKNDMSILQLPHARPDAILMDWHATLVDTHDAMYHAVDDVLPHLEELDLWDRLLDPDDSKTIEDAKLLMYVKDHHRLHPKFFAEQQSWGEAGDDP